MWSGHYTVFWTKLKNKVFTPTQLVHNAQSCLITQEHTGTETKRGAKSKVSQNCNILYNCTAML